MLRYTIRRLFQGIITVWFIATATFVAMHAVPGDPLIHDKAVTAQIRKNLEIKYGLDKPVTQQYLIYMGNMLKGDFGISFTQQNRSVNDIIVKHFPVSATLGILAVVFAAIGGILWGALTALYRNRLPDVVIMFLVILGISVPSFVFAALGQLALVNLNALFGRTLLPVAGWGTVAHMLVPSIVLGLGTMAFLTRLMRSSMLEIVNADYIRTAKAKGLPITRIFLKHELRNAILPVITVLGPAIAAITTGGFVVELVFAIPGLGRYFVQAVQQLDYTVIMGTTVFYGAFLVLMVILVDLLYGTRRSARATGIEAWPKRTSPRTHSNRSPRSGACSSSRDRRCRTGRTRGCGSSAIGARWLSLYIIVALLAVHRGWVRSCGAVDPASQDVDQVSQTPWADRTATIVAPYQPWDDAPTRSRLDGRRARAGVTAGGAGQYAGRASRVERRPSGNRLSGSIATSCCRARSTTSACRWARSTIPTRRASKTVSTSIRCATTTRWCRSTPTATNGPHTSRLPSTSLASSPKTSRSRVGLVSPDANLAPGDVVRLALHPFGTDYLGRDLLARLMYGARVSLFIGIVAPFFFVLLGIAVRQHRGLHRRPRRLGC